MQLGSLFKKYTVEQWHIIDHDFRGKIHAPTVDRKLLTVVLILLCVLILLQYVGKSAVVRQYDWFMAWCQVFPEPKLGPKLYWATFRVFFYCVPALLVIRYVYGAKLADFNIQLERNPKTLAIYGLILCLILPVVYGVSTSSAFLRQYPIYKLAGSSWFDLVVWELAYGAQFFALEFFYRGFCLVAFARVFGAAAIFIMAIPYTMIHFLKPMPEAAGAVLAAIVLGTLALRTRSIFGGVLIHISVAWAMDLLALYHKGQLSKLTAG